MYMSLCVCVCYRASYFHGGSVCLRLEVQVWYHHRDRCGQGSTVCINYDNEMYIAMFLCVCLLVRLSVTGDSQCQMSMHCGFCTVATPPQLSHTHRPVLRPHPPSTMALWTWYHWRAGPGSFTYNLWYVWSKIGGGRKIKYI